MDITLIVKASNQQIEDLTVQCDPTWTIRRLKRYLTEVYPGKPSTDEQKLIYSGQLLNDSIVLKDILRHYDGQETHTVHLVFTPKYNRQQKEVPSDGSTKHISNNSTECNSTNKKITSSKTATDTLNASMTTGNNISSSNEPSRAEDTALRNNFGADGLRQRITTSQNNATTITTPPMTSTNITGTAMSAELIMSQQMAMQNWMQQAYMQYFNQYMNALAANGQSNLQTYTNAPLNPAAPAVSSVNNIPAQSAFGTLSMSPDPLIAQTLPNLAYYPYLSTMHTSPMPSASSIPAPISSSGTIANSPVQAASVTPSTSSQPTFPNGATPSIPTPTAGGLSSDSTSSLSAAATSSVNTAAVATASTTQVQHSTVDRAPADGAAGAAGPAPAAGAAAAPAPARRFPNIVVEEQENRDWLDIFFSLCRVGILTTVIFLYSSPTRCLTVFFIGISLYLYQIGFFRNPYADRLEIARRTVFQQINNAHGARANAAARGRPAPVAPAAPEPVINDQVPVGTAAVDATVEADPSSLPSSTDVTDASKGALQQQNENVAPSNSTTTESQSDVHSSIKEATPAAPAATTSSSMEPNEVQGTPGDLEDQSNAAVEANRIIVNDVAGFFRTLVLSFFTSFIPDTPAA